MVDFRIMYVNHSFATKTPGIGGLTQNGKIEDRRNGNSDLPGAIEAVLSRVVRVQFRNNLRSGLPGEIVLFPRE